MPQVNMNMSNVEPDAGFDPIPPGEYQLQVVDSDVKTSSGGNLMAVFTYEVVGEQYAGRKLFDHFVLNNDIATKRLKSLCVACGHPNPDFLGNTEELHGKTFLAKVKIERDKSGKYDDQNKVSTYKPPQAGQGAPAPAAAAPPSASAVPAGPAATPWGGGNQAAAPPVAPPAAASQAASTPPWQQG